MKKFELVVLGGGTAGLTIAEEASAHGWEVALVEESMLGGTCVNVGCIPTKTLIHSSKVMRYVRRASVYGINIAHPGVDWPTVTGRKDALVRDMRENIQQSINDNEKIHFQPFKYVIRAMAMALAEEDGLIKLIVDEKTDVLLGAHILGPSAGELIHELVAAIRFEARLADLQDSIHIHPTLAEGINSAALS